MTVRGVPHRTALMLAVTVYLVLGASVPAAQAHPLGNFTFNTAVRLVIGPDGADLRYILDLAEIPTTRFRQDIDLSGDGTISSGEIDTASSRRCEELLRGVTIRVDDAVVRATPTAATLTFPQGQAGLPTSRVTCDARVEARTGNSDLTVADENVADHIGWREITAVGDRATLTRSNVPAASSTALLRQYPPTAASDPLRTTSADITVRAGGPPAADDALDGGAATQATDPGLFERVTLAYTDLIAERALTPGFAIVAMLLAMLLGTLHALAPGHGKTVIAAYVVGQRGTARHALGIGATVAITHTMGVLLLGVLLSTSKVLAPERIYPWLGVFSGALIVAIGLGLVRRAVASRRREVPWADHAHHHHVQGDGPGEEPDDVDAPHGHSHVLPDADLGWHNLVALGVAGGMAPSPSALLVLIGAIALGRVWFGVVLVVFYGIGLAGLLVVGGLALVRVRGAAERLLAFRERPRLRRLTNALPLVTGVVVVLGGITIAVRGWVL